MNVYEGAKRMRRAGQWMIVISLAELTLLAFAGLYGAHFDPGLGGPLLLFFFVFVTSGALLWLAGWIVEGFAKSAH
jgi:hypothetical protein